MTAEESKIYWLWGILEIFFKCELVWKWVDPNHGFPTYHSDCIQFSLRKVLLLLNWTLNLWYHVLLQQLLWRPGLRLQWPGLWLWLWWVCLLSPMLLWKILVFWLLLRYSRLLIPWIAFRCCCCCYCIRILYYISIIFYSNTNI